MFDRLLESDRRSPNGLSHSGTALFAHAALIAAAVWAPARRPAVIDRVWGELSVMPAYVERKPATPNPAAPSVGVVVDLPPDLQISPDFGLMGVEPPAPGIATPGPAATPRSVASDSGVAIESMLDYAPEMLAGVPPGYPEPLRQAGIEGRVEVQAILDTLGRVEPGSIRIVRTTNPGFDRPARDYLSRALFRPGRVLGRAVRVLIVLPIDFRISR